MSAERLRQAASLLRERAEAATPGPWQLDGPFWWRGGDTNPDCTTVITAGVDRLPVVVLPEDRDRRDTSDADAAFIATASPAVALALADWLDDQVDRWGWTNPALAVADAILGPTS
jgi:hypothetical protein